jgi:hypothetical protein
MADSRRDLDPIQTRQPLIVIQCNLMRVGRWRERLEEPLFCKISLYLDSLEHVGGERTRLYCSPSFVNIVQTF